MAHLSTACKCLTYGPCPCCGTSAITTSPWGDVLMDNRYYAPPSKPKSLVPVNVLLPGIALTPAARIARKYLANKGK